MRAPHPGSSRRRPIRHWPLLVWLALLVGVTPAAAGAATARVLIVYEGGPSPFVSALPDARQLRQLLGHFSTEVTLQAAEAYRPGEAAQFDTTFVIGFQRTFVPAPALAKDMLAARRTVVAIDYGIVELARRNDLAKLLGFVADRYDTTSSFDQVQAGSRRFSKTDPTLQILTVTDPARCQVLATATSSRTGSTAPYAVRSGNFWCIADSPFSYATEADRYLFFADLLHDILGQDHPPSHRAIIRIEDTNPMSDPTALRTIADLLASRRVPFLVGVVPIYVNPGSAARVAMSERPDYVDALRYMVAHGGTVVMHGDTHQFRGESTADYEFWDESSDRVLPSDSRELVERKLREGLTECLKNGITPLIWETPHYSASTLDYQTVAAHFSSAIEQRMVLDRLDQSQYFPYIIQRDMYGQRLYPENLGYVPLDAVAANEQASVDKLLGFARANLQVRDGWASAFFHPFVRLEMLERLVDGIAAMGFEFVDLRSDAHVVTLDDRAIVCGKARVTLQLQDQYLLETTYDSRGEVVRRLFSETRLNGTVERNVDLPKGSVWVAEPREYRERQPSWFDRARTSAHETIDRLVMTEAATEPADVLHLEDPEATGGALNDQMSLAAPFQAINVPVEHQVVTPAWTFDPGEHNLLLVPYAVADTLAEARIAEIRRWVEGGGNVVTDFRSRLATGLGMRFLDTPLRVERVRDKLFPEEALRWRVGEVMSKFEVLDSDTVLAVDEESEFPVALVRRVGNGRLVYFGTRFDPVSTGGFSRFPYLVHEIQKSCGLTPLLRREQLEVYFDPGFRHNVSVEQLAVRWADAGIRVVFVGGWHEYPKYTYDYDRLIRVCHANGILVYAWLEPPQVSEKFWREHPEWREKNFKGEDVRPSWRYPVALTEPACLTAALTHYRKLLTAFDWDGVNIGELYFEAGQGMKEPQLLTPLHPSARAEFKRLHGFDPIDLFREGASRRWPHDPGALKTFLDWRVDRIVDLHTEFLAMAESVRLSRPGFEVIVTALDSKSAPELREYIGIDTGRIAALGDRFRFTLQVEDPESMWSEDPRRYVAIGERYRGLVPPDRLALDLNILSFRSATQLTPFPTRIQTGTEAFWLVNSSAVGASRVAIYSESSLNPQDLAFLPAAYAARTRVARGGDGGWDIDTPTPIVVQLGTSVRSATRDGVTIHSLGHGRFLLPVGAYTVEAEPPALGGLQPDQPEAVFLSITGDLLDKRSTARSVSFRYRSATRCLVTFTREPFTLRIDGRETPIAMQKGAGRAALMLPPGEHEVAVVTQSTISWGVDFTSFWSSSFIAAFGAVAVGLLFVLWLVVRVRRPRSE